MRLNDLILFIVVFVSMAVAVFFPSTGLLFQPLLLPFMMILLFLSFFKIDFGALLDTSRPALGRLGLFVAVKLFILPVTLYFIALLIVPDFAIPVLLLSGVSTGVVAPFIGMLVDAAPAMVLRMVIVTSILLPFTLPALVKILAGSEMTIPLHLMVRLLAMVIFFPMVVVWGMRRFLPTVIDGIQRVQFPVSMVLLAAVNLGVFSKYSDFFFRNPGQIILATGIAYVLALIYYLAGVILSPGQEMREKVAAGISLAIMNNVLVIVFSAEFFGPLSPTLAAMYMFPFFTMIVPVKLIANRLNNTVSPKVLGS